LFGLQAWLIFIWMVLLVVNFYFYSLMATDIDYHPIWLSVALFSLFGAYMLIFGRDVIEPKPLLRESRLAPAELPLLKDRLEALMENQRPYLNPDLTLHELAALLELKEKDLSELLNAGLKTSFYHYINGYRLEAVKKMLLDQEKQHLTNFAIAQEAGFSSRSSFFNLFKKEMGMTPGAFKKDNL
ncbi:MAG: AraC family transcriptional regulator, partial [Sinomicrobium sp.]|nr:AraC family transcriptional regulator [Sinomicrobium sp.]